MNRIRYLRIKKELKQDELAKIIHVSQASLSGYENEKFEPDKKTLIKLADYFGVTVDYLLGLEGCTAQGTGKSSRVPVYRRLRKGHAGLPIWAILDFDNTFESSTEANGEFFGLVVEEDSMAPRIMKGDIVIANKKAEVRTGDTVVIQVQSRCATLKKIIKQESGITLFAYNPNYHPIFFSNEEMVSLPVLILGKAVEIRGRC